MTKQLTWEQAERLAEKFAREGLGFDASKEGVVPKGTTYADFRRCAAVAVVRALREMGHLAASDAASRQATDRAASAAKARHDTWKRATGATC